MIGYYRQNRLNLVGKQTAQMEWKAAMIPCKCALPDGTIGDVDVAGGILDDEYPALALATDTAMDGKRFWCVVSRVNGYALAKFDSMELANAFVVDSLKIVEWDLVLPDLPIVSRTNAEKIMALVELNAGSVLAC